MREQLNSGAVLLTRFQGMTGELKQVAPGELTLPAGWDDTVAEVGAFRGQLRLWFADEDKIVKAFDDVLSHAVWASELREGISEPTDSLQSFDAGRPASATRTRTGPIIRTARSRRIGCDLVSTGLPAAHIAVRVPFRTELLLGVVVNWPSVGLTINDDACAPCWSVRRIPTHGRLTPCAN